MEMITHNPTDGIYASTPDYVHAIEVRAPSRLLFVAGTMGLDAGGRDRGHRGRLTQDDWLPAGHTLADASSGGG